MLRKERNLRYQQEFKHHAWVAELVDARDLKSLGAKSLYEFDSRPRHQISSRISHFWEVLFL